MRFKTMTKAFRSVMFALVAFSFASVAAHAQAAARGKFELPYAVEWGGVTLAPGHYRYSIRPAASGSVVRITSESSRKVHAMVMASAWNPIATTSDNHLVIERQGDVYFVRTLALGCIGAEYLYLPPKTKSGLLMASKAGGL